MQQAVQFPSHVPAAGPNLIGAESMGQWPTAGISAAWRKLLLQAEMAAPHVKVASIEGETGTGKQTLARYLQQYSPLSGTPFLRKDAREWLLNDCDPNHVSGFIYLDRVDLLTPPGQSLLLTLLKSLQDRPANRIMLIASSQLSLRQMTTQGQILPDLAFRLTAVRLAIPPLRMRKEDIAPIAGALLNQLSARYGRGPVELGSGVLARLHQHTWPGNVRELAGILEGALLESETTFIRTADLAIPEPTVPLHEPEYPTDSGTLSLDEVIRRHVQHVLDVNRGNKLRAARQLGISRSTLYRILGNETILSR